MIIYIYKRIKHSGAAESGSSITEAGPTLLEPTMVRACPSPAKGTNEEDRVKAGLTKSFRVKAGLTQARFAELDYFLG